MGLPSPQINFSVDLGVALNQLNNLNCVSYVGNAGFNVFNRITGSSSLFS